LRLVRFPLRPGSAVGTMGCGHFGGSGVGWHGVRCTLRVCLAPSWRPLDRPRKSQQDQAITVPGYTKLVRLLEYSGSSSWALNSAVECHPHTVEVVGSNPTAPTIASLRCDGITDHLVDPAQHFTSTKERQTLEPCSARTGQSPVPTQSLLTRSECREGEQFSDGNAMPTHPIPMKGYKG
jgi:hypothetical protein